MEKELWCIIGVSSAKDDLTVEEADQMLKYVREDRKSKGITSLVAVSNKNALFLIEGEKSVVKDEFNSIKNHVGHHNIIKTFDQPITQRLFEDYPLAFKSISNDLKSIDDFKEPEHKEYFEAFLTMELPISKIVSDFIKNNI